MEANKTKVLDIIEGTKQYIVPLFQRTYSWERKHWENLWKDLFELHESDNPRTHFIGSIVSMPTVSVPEGVNKYLLIDGQQRLTTIFVILVLLRNKSREVGKTEYSEEIQNTLLVNQYKKGNDYYKIMPTQVDRDSYMNLINNPNPNYDSRLGSAYQFFDRKLKENSFDYDKIKKVIVNFFSVVSIVLDLDDNPYLVFESLNAKGMPLKQSDLIRNYFFMRIHQDLQEDIYKNYWKPMEDDLGDDLTEFIRHYLVDAEKGLKRTICRRKKSLSTHLRMLPKHKQ